MEMILTLLRHQIPVIFRNNLYENILGDFCILERISSKTQQTYRKLTKEEIKTLTVDFKNNLRIMDRMIFEHIIEHHITFQREAFIKSKL